MTSRMFSIPEVRTNVKKDLIQRQKRPIEEDGLHTSSKQDQALETEAKARVHARAVLAQVLDKNKSLKKKSAPSCSLL